MTELFQAKRVLDRMNKIGNRHFTLSQTANAAALDLLMFPTSDPVELAKQYAKYELDCIVANKKPLTLVKWFMRRNKL